MKGLAIVNEKLFTGEGARLLVDYAGDLGLDREVVHDLILGRWRP